MCGVAGYVLARGVEPGPARLLRMLHTLRRRGPDDEGLVLVTSPAGDARSFRTHDTVAGADAGARVDPGGRYPHAIALGHRRFSIIDLSAAAHQPFWSADREVCVAFNGEIYNYVEVREELARLGHRFRTSSDTEVLAQAYLEWGEGCFERLNGFFAVTLYDARRGAVLLARDRVGKAPLYLARRPEGLYWCSEIKGLREALGESAFRVRDQAVDDFVVHGWRDLFHETFYAGIATFPAASWAWVEPDGSQRATSYWSVPRERLRPREISVDEACARFRDVLQDAARIRLRADVPVGLELSGGLDSSSIVAVAVGLRSGSRLHAYTVSYPGSEYDELPFATAVAQRYAHAIEHVVLEPANASITDDLDGFVAHMDEPYHDPVLHSQVEIWGRMRAMGMRVSLNGAGGDEVLAGYGSDFFLPYLRHLLGRGRLVRFAREFFGYTEHVPGRMGFEHLRRAYRMLPDGLRLYHNPAMDLPPDVDPYRPGRDVSERTGPAGDIRGLLLDYMTHWRMNYWVRGGNQLSMSLPLEYRCPFLDHRMVELGFRLPLGYLIRDGWTKWIVRKALRGLLPDEILWRRRKAGFRYPLRERLPACRADALDLLRGLECPYLDLARLRDGYDEINRRDPNRLWRMLSLAFFWKRCVSGERLVPRRARSVPARISQSGARAASVPETS